MSQENEANATFVYEHLKHGFDAADLEALLARVRGGETVTLRALRDGEPVEITLTPSDPAADVAQLSDRSKISVAVQSLD